MGRRITLNYPVTPYSVICHSAKKETVAGADQQAGRVYTPAPYEGGGGAQTYCNGPA